MTNEQRWELVACEADGDVQGVNRLLESLAEQGWELVSTGQVLSGMDDAQRIPAIFLKRPTYVP